VNWSLSRGGRNWRFDCSNKMPSQIYVWSVRHLLYICVDVLNCCQGKDRHEMVLVEFNLYLFEMFKIWAILNNVLVLSWTNFFSFGILYIKVWSPHMGMVVQKTRYLAVKNFKPWASTWLLWMFYFLNSYLLWRHFFFKNWPSNIE